MSCGERGDVGRILWAVDMAMGRKIDILRHFANHVYNSCMKTVEKGGVSSTDTFSKSADSVFSQSCLLSVKGSRPLSISSYYNTMSAF